jgi:rhodanese-related sulfurtransferase
MRAKRSVKDAPSPSTAVFSLLFGAWKEALVLFLGASAFAVLFNAFYADGIELKVAPKRTVPHPVQTPTGYAGFGKASPVPSAKRTPRSPVSFDIPRLSLQGAYARFQKKASVFLDARKPEEYQGGHIPGALNFYGNELDQYAPRIIPQLTDKAQEIIAYCHGGDCDLSLQVAKTLKEQGYTQVKIFQDGWPAWTKAGYPQTQGERP